VPLNEKEVTSGKYEGVPLIALYWGQSVSFVLTGDAARHFRFKNGREALKLVAAELGPSKDKPSDSQAASIATTVTPTDRSLLDDVDVRTTDSTLTLTIKPNTPQWVAKGTLYFDSRGESRPAPNGVDPSFANWGPTH
jgi:hypothetical protein